MPLSGSPARACSALGFGQGVAQPERRLGLGLSLGRAARPARRNGERKEGGWKMT